MRYILAHNNQRISYCSHFSSPSFAQLRIHTLGVWLDQDCRRLTVLRNLLDIKKKPPEMETPQPLWATCANAWSPLQGKGIPDVQMESPVFQFAPAACHWMPLRRAHVHHLSTIPSGILPAKILPQLLFNRGKVLKEGWNTPKCLSKNLWCCSCMIQTVLKLAFFPRQTCKCHS